LNRSRFGVEGPVRSGGGGTSEVGPYLLGVWMVELFEQCQGGTPGTYRRVVLAEGVVRVADVGQAPGFVVAFPALPEECEGLFVAADRLA
jgi:hypothetical protein